MAENRGKAGGIVGGLILILLGILFLISQFVEINFWAYLWPVILLLVAAVFFVAALSGDRGASGLVIPGSIIGMIGLIMLYQNIFQKWETWSYAWGLIVVGVGIGVFIHGHLSGQEGARRSGASLIKIGLTLFIAFGAFFELIIFGNLAYRRAEAIFWPLALIVFGAYLLVRRSLVRPANKESEATVTVETPAPAEEKKED